MLPGLGKDRFQGIWPVKMLIHKEEIVMYNIHGFSLSFNTCKVLYVAEELGVEYVYTALDLMKGEHKSDAHMKRHPLGKTPTLDHDGRYLFESGAICRYLAAVTNSALYSPDDPYERAQIEQWMDFFTCHLGRWLGTLLFERVVREQFGMGQKKVDVEEEALGFIEQQMACLNNQLAANAFLAGARLSIADPFAFAYMETCEMSGFSLTGYPNVGKWLDNYGQRDAVQRARAKLGRT
jgi:glutathione S-transferase